MLFSTEGKSMTLVLSSILIALVATGAPSARNSRTPRSIRDVDFRNFTFNWYPPDADTPLQGRKIILMNGEMDTGWVGEERRTFFLINTPIKYGDLTGDGHEEAVVVLGTIISGTARPGVIFVYTMLHGKPTLLLAYETGDRWDYGYHSASIHNDELIIERYKPYVLVYEGQKHDVSSSDSYIREHYKWDGARFRKIGSETVPVDAKDSAPWAHRI
jgi:hypothetical protein